MLDFRWLTGVSQAHARFVFLILFLIIAVLVLMIPKRYIHEGVDNPRWWHNLKLWALGVLLMIFITYCIF